jgi:serine/threonine protein kinase
MLGAICGGTELLIVCFCFPLQKDLSRVYREIEALKRLHHQHIGQLFQIIETPTMIHLVLEVGV